MDRLDLHAYVDGELSKELQAEIKVQLSGSPEAQREVEAIQALKSMLSQRSVQPDTAAEWRKCVSRLNEIDKTRKVERIVSRFAPALCATMFATILIAGMFRHKPETGSISSQAWAKMAGTLSPMHPPKNPGFDKDAWLGDLISQSRLSTPDHLTVRGVSSGELNGIPVRSFAARDETGDLTLFVVKQPLELEGFVPIQGHPNLHAGKLNGINCVVQSADAETVLIVADRSYDQLANVASQISLR